MSDDPQDTMQMGLQPLDRILVEAGLENHDLVEAGRAEQLTYKQVQKARRGRRITRRMQEKIARAASAATGSSHRVDDLFNY